MAIPSLRSSGFIKSIIFWLNWCFNFTVKHTLNLEEYFDSFVSRSNGSSNGSSKSPTENLTKTSTLQNDLATFGKTTPYVAPVLEIKPPFQLFNLSIDVATLLVPIIYRDCSEVQKFGPTLDSLKVWSLDELPSKKSKNEVWPEDIHRTIARELTLSIMRKFGNILTRCNQLFICQDGIQPKQKIQEQIRRKKLAKSVNVKTNFTMTLLVHWLEYYLPLLQFFMVNSTARKKILYNFSSSGEGESKAVAFCNFEQPLIRLVSSRDNDIYLMDLEWQERYPIENHDFIFPNTTNFTIDNE